MKKIFILTGEPSGDKLASRVIINLKRINPSIEYLSVGGENLKSIGIQTIYNLEEITYSGFTKVFLNIFKLNKKINQTVDAIIKFKPNILLTVDSPDFTLRVAERVKKKLSDIRTVHYVAPQVWIWREGRAKKMRKFIDHIMVLFKFEKQYFEKENIDCKFVGHPLLDNNKLPKIDINQFLPKNKVLISVFPGSRISEINILMPILINFIKLMNTKYKETLYIFHSTLENVKKINSLILSSGLKNYEVISDEKIKTHMLHKSIFAVSKSGTVSLEICNAEIPSIILYKMSFINFFIIKSLVKTKFANIINFVARKEIIPELLQDKCNAQKIYNIVAEYLDNPVKIKNQILETKEVLKNFKTEKNSSELASIFLNNLLK